MSAQCAKLETFADGELEPVDAENFRHHLAQCGHCEERLTELLALELVDDDARRAAEAAAPAPGNVRPLAAWRRKAWLVAVPLALAAGLATLMLVPRREPDMSALFLAQAPTRSLEARVTHPGADGYRPYAVMRSGGSGAQALPLRELARLDEAGDMRGIATAYLLRGETAQASAFLDKLPGAPDVDTDRAVVALQRGAPEEALALLERALKVEPRHPQALWNQGLALRTLGLPLKAAEAFDKVAALKEPGWSEEAAALAGQLRDKAAGERKSWEGTYARCRGMVAGGEPLSAEQASAHPGLARLCLYDALRAAPSAERVEALRPLAVQLDRVDGGTHLEDHVRRAARRDFTVRKPLAEQYARITDGKSAPAELEALLGRLREARQEDLLLGALLFVRDARRHLEEYRALALATEDPWFALLAEERAAKADIQRGQMWRARERLREALRGCGEDGRFNYRCMMLQRELALLETRLHHPKEGQAQALAALQRARRGREWSTQLLLLQELGQTAQTRDALVLASAYMEEVILQTPDKCLKHDLSYTHLAMAHHRALDFAKAREQLDKAARCGLPPSLARAFVLADLARTPYRRPEDAALLRSGLDALRASEAVGVGEALLARHVEGRFTIELDRARGQALLRQAITEAQPLLASDVNARKARAYSYTSLLMDAGRHQALDTALALFAEELSLPPPERCALGVTVDDERTLVAARDANGRLLGHYDASRGEPLSSVEGLVPPALVEALRACPTVEVLARPPLQGRPGLLPPDLAWAYRAGTARAPAPALPPRRLVVADVLAPEALGLPALRTWGTGGGADPSIAVLKGAAATPSRVLSAMQDATEVEIHAHGLLDPRQVGDSLLVLSPEGERYALTSSDLRGHQLRGRPVVLLAACYAAHTTPSFHETFGLPMAFLQAGASTVLAATREIPDTEAQAFFEPVLARIRAGEPAAAVLRDEREAWLRERGSTWVHHVLLFQ